jgi:hypothetical protein
MAVPFVGGGAESCYRRKMHSPNEKINRLISQEKLHADSK